MPPSFRRPFPLALPGLRHGQELADRLSALEGLSGEKNKEGALRRQLEETLTSLREIRAARKTESGDLESVKAANDEADKLREELKRRDYRILHLTRALDELSAATSSGRS